MSFYIEPSTTPKVYSFYRFSTPDQREGDSKRRQLQGAKDYAEARGIEFDEALVIPAEGISAYRGKHLAEGSALGAFVQAVRVGAVAPGSTLVIENLDRLSRMVVRRTAKLLLDLVEEGVTVVTLDPYKEYSAESLDNESGGLVTFLELAIHAHRAHSESVEKGKRLQKTWVGKRERLKANPAAKLTSSCPPWLRLEWLNAAHTEGRFHEVPERVEIVRRIVREALAGKGQHAITQGLVADGVPVFSDRGTIWRRTYVKTLLTNKALVGTLVMRDSVYPDGKRVRTVKGEVPGYFPAVISEADFAALQALQSTRSPLRGKNAGAGVQNVFGGLAVCGRCGGRMTRINKSASRTGNYLAHYLVCERARVGSADCRYTALRYPMVEAAFIDSLGDILSDAPLGQAVDEINAELHDIDSAMLDLAEQHADALRAMRQRRSAATAATIRDLEVQRDELTAEREALEQRRTMAAAPLVQARLAELWDACLSEPLDRTKVNAAMRKVFRSVVFDPDRFTLVGHFTHQGETRPILFKFPEE